MSVRHRGSAPAAPPARGFILLAVVLALALVASVAFLLNRSGGMNMALAARALQADKARYLAEAGLAQINAQTQAHNCSGYADLSATAFGANQFVATVNPKSGTPVTLVATGTLADGSSITLTRSGVTAHQTTPYAMTLSPNTSSKDTYLLSSNPGANYGISTTLAVQPGIAVTLVQFDLSSIPAGSDVRSAQLSLYQIAGAADTVNAYPVTTAWSNGNQNGGAGGTGADWDKSSGSNTWVTPGGDYDTGSGATVTLPGSGWATWDVTEHVAAWMAGTQPNYGNALVAANGAGDTFISGNDTSNPRLHPTLVVTFLPPCGWTAPPTGATLSASADVWIDEASATVNFGGAATVDARGASGNLQRALVQFDLSTVPAGTVLTSATLRLYVNSVTNPAAATLSVYRPTESWTEGTKTGNGSANGATWTTRDGSTNWNPSAGGSYDTSAAATAALGAATTSGWVEWDVTTLVQSMLDGVVPNYGMLIDNSAASGIEFDSRESGTNTPQLVLTW